MGIFTDDYDLPHETDYEVRCDHLSMQNYDMDSRIRAMREWLPEKGDLPTGEDATTALEDLRFLLYHKFRPDWKERVR